MLVLYLSFAQSMAWSCAERSSWYLTDVLYTIFLEYKAFLKKFVHSFAALSQLFSLKQNITPPQCRPKPFVVPISYTSSLPSHDISSSIPFPSPTLLQIHSFSSPPPSNHRAFSPLRQIKPETLHTTPVLADQVPTRGLGVLGGGEQHALVARGFFLFADAAGLGLCCVGGGVGGLVGGGEVVDLEGVGGCGNGTWSG